MKNDNNGNIGYLYYEYEEYYEKYYEKYYKIHYEDIIKGNTPKIKEGLFEDINKEIILDSNIEKLLEVEHINLTNIEEFKLKTNYPGLIIGAGYSHDIKQIEAFKLGLEFDYTTGFPVINGSSIKGVLRSMFYNENDEENLKNSKKEYIQGILNDKKKFNCKIDLGKDFKKFKDITYAIFEGKKINHNNQEILMPIFERDIFFQAFINKYETLKAMKNSKCKEVLGEDYITPHGGKKGKLKNPIPIKFLKVMPNVVWNFRFALNDTVLNYSGSNGNIEFKLTKKDKLELFKSIILDRGVGAKTNVGYSNFEDWDKK